MCFQCEFSRKQKHVNVINDMRKEVYFLQFWLTCKLSTTMQVQQLIMPKCLTFQRPFCIQNSKVFLSFGSFFDTQRVCVCVYIYIIYIYMCVCVCVPLQYWQIKVGHRHPKIICHQIVRNQKNSWDKSFFFNFLLVWLKYFA